MSNQPQAPGVIYVCPERDIECGRNPASWCAACPQQPQAHVADERAAFEQEMLRRDIIGDEGFDRRATGEYVDDTTEAAWESWQAARAAIPAGADVRTLAEFGALRQLKHNDGSEALVTAYDYEVTNRYVAMLRALIAAGASAETAKPIYQVELDPKFGTWMDINEADGAVWNRKCFNVRTIYAAQPAPAPATDARDALDAARYRWLRDTKTDVALVLDKRTEWVPPDENIPGIGGYHTYEYRAGDELDAAIDAAMLSANSPREAG